MLKKGYFVKVYDTFWYGKNIFSENKSDPKLELIESDIRDSDKLSNSIKGCTDVIHLACISNDPSYDLDPKLGEEVNFNSFEPLVNYSINSGVQRFIYASSSSVYGVKEEEKVTEKLLVTIILL